MIGQIRRAALLLLCAVMCMIIFYDITLPDNYYVAAGNELSVKSRIAVTGVPLFPANYPSDNRKLIGDEAVSVLSSVNGIVKRQSMLTLFGIIPIKEVTVTEVSLPLIVPCGDPFGIKMTTEGVMVVELASFDSGKALVSPAKDAGIREGDLIVSISGRKVSSNSEISSIISECGGETLGVRLIRDGESRVLFITPEMSADDGAYHAGMWVRDSSAGIGTVTFYDPLTGVFAGLGHPVCDCDTGEVLTMAEGQSADVYISGVKKSSAGCPGELIGTFISGEKSGTLELNCESGLYGHMDSIPSDNPPVEAAMRQDVKTGKACIYTTVEGTRPEKYDISIEKVSLDDTHGRNMVIKVTDPLLLEKTGGIVQGMSGSPIIQDGKLVGAVTHVLVSDPEKGYAIFADTMIDTAKHLSEANEICSGEYSAVS